MHWQAKSLSALAIFLNMCTDKLFVCQWIKNQKRNVSSWQALCLSKAELRSKKWKRSTRRLRLLTSFLLVNVFKIMSKTGQNVFFLTLTSKKLVSGSSIKSTDKLFSCQYIKNIPKWSTDKQKACQCKEKKKRLKK